MCLVFRGEARVRTEGWRTGRTSRSGQRNTGTASGLGWSFSWRSPPSSTVFPPLSSRHMQAKCNTHGVSAISKYRTNYLQGMQERAPHVPTESTHGTSKRASLVPFFFFFSSFHFWKQKANTCESFLGNYDWKTLRHVSFQIYRMLPEINT